MVKHTQTICRLLPTNCLCAFDHFLGLAFKRLSHVEDDSSITCTTEKGNSFISKEIEEGSLDDTPIVVQGAKNLVLKLTGKVEVFICCILSMKNGKRWSTWERISP